MAFADPGQPGGSAAMSGASAEAQKAYSVSNRQRSRSSSGRGTVKAAELIVLSQDEFSRTLCLERKRTERSRRPFVLMLLELGSSIAHDRDAVVTMLCQSTRDTD